MADLQRLFVNLGASQTRRRLKGFGHGVQRVETSGNNKAVITHTATGKHLRQLEAKFTDVGFAETEAGLNTPIDLIERSLPEDQPDDSLHEQE